MTRADFQTLHEKLVSLACFEVRGGLYALDVACVREIVRWRPVTPLPRTPALIQGMVDLRGSLIPVVDLGRVLLDEPVAASPHARIVVAELDGLALGLLVDAAIDVRSVEVASLGDLPALATRAGYEMASAIVRRPDATPIVVIALEQVLERVYRSVLRDEEAA